MISALFQVKATGGISVRRIITALFICWATLASAQHDYIRFMDHVYVDNIRSVRLHIDSLFLSYPIIALGSVGSLRLTFDDMDSDFKYYTYTMIHCDKDWQPSDLLFREYVDGFEDEEIENFAYSINTKVNYSHYELLFPNDDMQLTKSGNYLLVVYEDANPSLPVLTRRFMVVDQKVSIDAMMQRPANVSKYTTHHELDFEVRTNSLKILNPKGDITAVVMQNGRWDNAITGITSKFERGETLFFDYQDKIVFGAGKDFRNLDIRSTQYRSEDVFEIQDMGDHIAVVAEIDKPRVYSNYISDEDINGSFVILTTDDTRFSFEHRLEGDTTVRWTKHLVELTDHSLESDYLKVLFTLEVEEPYRQDVYIFGGMTDWQLRDRFRMEYDRSYSAYLGEVWLKQGFYDYIYVLANTDGSEDETTIEGNWYEAGNAYTVLVYYHPFGGRYDQLVGATTEYSSR